MSDNPPPGYLKPDYHHPIKSYYELKSEVPYCAKNSKNNKSWCLSDTEYPFYDIQYALDQHIEAVQSLFKDVMANTANSVDELNRLGDETYLCSSSTAYVQPLRAVNVEGKWRIIVNKVESYGYKYAQTARIEECDAPVGTTCTLVPSCYDSKCVQKSVFHRFLVFDPYDQYFPFAIESFKLPASCACVVAAFFP